MRSWYNIIYIELSKLLKLNTTLMTIIYRLFHNLGVPVGCPAFDWQFTISTFHI
jgi:hypothetical protein